MQQATHPPLYFLALRLWRNIAGEDDFTSRLFSLLCSLAAIAFLYDTVLRMHGPNPAIWAAILMAVAGPQIEYAQATRNYAFLLMVALAAANALIRIEKSGPKLPYLIWLAAALLATALTHYFSVGALLALFAYTLIQFRGPSRWKTSIAFAAAAILFLILWGPQILTHLKSFSSPERTTEFLYDRSPGHALRILNFLLTLPIALLTSAQLSSQIWTIAGIVLTVFFFTPLRRRNELLFWWLWLAATVGFIALLDLARGTQQMAFVRYTLLASPAIFALIAAIPSKWGKIAPHAIPAAFTLLCLITLRFAYGDPRPDFKDLASILSQAGPRDLLIFAAPTRRASAPAELYLGYSHYKNPLQRSPVLIMTDSLSPEVRAELPKFDQVWLINASPEIPPTALIPNLPARGPVKTTFPAQIWEILAKPLPRPQPRTQPATRPARG